VLTALQKRDDTELQVVAAASALTWRHGRVVDHIRADGFTDNLVEIPCVVEGGGTRESVISTGLLMTQMPAILRQLDPDVVVTIADRHETIATAVCASYQNIPLCHIQGGEVSGSIDDKVRDAVTQLASIHCVATEQAAQNVRLARGAMADIHVTGCPSIDLAREALELGPLPGHDVVVLQHPVTDEVDQAGAQIRETIQALEGMDVLWFWPGEDAGADAMSKEMRLAGLRPVRNLPPLAFLRTLLGSGVLVGNSSVGIRECSYLGVPVVNIGTRQRGRERGPNVHDVAHYAEEIRFEVRRLTRALAMPPPTNRSNLYGDGHAGERIAEILVEVTDGAELQD
jgi:UDP-hydrolysing UDP-N-acetyl-D-glucosamine 2-epimerase